MKLRIRGNSLRLRLTKGEVKQFGQNGKVTDSIKFPAGEIKKLSYSLISTEKSNCLITKFDYGKISILVPLNIANEWIQTEQVGFRAEQVLGDGDRLKVLIEKDFVCLKEREGENESDNFPNPYAEQGC